MGISVNHVHIKTRDPVATAKYYVDNFGARIKEEIPGRGLQVDLHGLQLNITTLIKEQNHGQHYGIEHIALTVDDYPGTLSKLRANGVEILEELPPNNGRRVCFLAATDGSQIELIEKA
jgi:catechol 2,3-dioxygenase-like lactoylglutathione lyase family enzyme